MGSFELQNVLLTYHNKLTMLLKGMHAIIPKILAETSFRRLKSQFFKCFNQAVLARQALLRNLIRAKCHHEFKGAVCEGCVVRAENDCVPDHDVVLARSSAHTCGWVFLETFEVSHKSSSGCCRHSEGILFSITK